MPRDRTGEFHTQVFERYGRYEPEVAEVLTEMFVSGTSPYKVAETLTGVAPSSSAVSCLNHTLIEQFDAWCEWSLLPHYRILYLDGIHFTVRHGAQTNSTIILTALGVDLEGNKEVLACGRVQKKTKMGGAVSCKMCGATQMDLIVTDGKENWKPWWACSLSCPITLR